jgi:hypothetical protein
MKKAIALFLPLLVAFVLSCNKDENNETPIVSNTYSITLAGQINDENGQGIPNVTVQVGNKIDQTDGNGIYLIEKVSVNKSRAVVKATKTGYWNRSSGFIPSNSTVQYCNLVMAQKAAATSIQSSTGGSATSAGATVVFPPNAFVTATGLPYSGTVNITSKHLATTDPNFGELIPGGDLMAEDNASNSVILISYGMIGVELTDNNGNPLQLGLGIKANIQLPIASAQLATAPATIPLWYFDETKSLWIEEGIATKQGNNYVGQVSHFSWWNCDQPTPAATICGYVYDAYGNPIVNAFIYYNNVGGAFTDQNGFYSGQVPSGPSSTIYSTYIGINSPILSIPALTAGQLYNVPDIILSSNSYGKFKANFVDCNNQPTNTYIQFNGATSNSFIYAPNGLVNTIIQCGAKSINAYTSNGFFDSTFIQSCYPDSNDLGIIVICDTTTNSSNIFFKFNLSSSILNVNFLEINPFNIYADCQFSNSIIQLNVWPNFTPVNFYCFFGGFFNYAPGTYTAPSPGLEIEYGNGLGSYYIYPDTLNPNLNFTIIQNGAVGDTLELMINGPVLVYDNDTTTVSGTLNNFHLKCIRTN